MTDPTAQGGVELPYTQLHAPHDRLAVTSLTQRNTYDGVAFTADLHLNGTKVGTIENAGTGGATMLYSPNDLFGWRGLRGYAANCRLRGAPIDDEEILNTLVDEYDLGRAINEAARRNGSVVKLVTDDGHLAEFRTTLAVPTTPAARRLLASALARTPPNPFGRDWLLWTGTGWQHVATAPAA